MPTFYYHEVRISGNLLEGRQHSVGLVRFCEFSLTPSRILSYYVIGLTFDKSIQELPGVSCDFCNIFIQQPQYFPTRYSQCYINVDNKKNKPAGKTTGDITP